MTTSPRSPSRTRIGMRTWIALLCLVTLLPLLASTQALAGSDDFEFGKKLAASRFFDYARKVFDGILKDPNRSDEEKGEARYGLALLRKEEAIAATGSTDAKYRDIVKLFDSAADDIADFVKKNPKNANAAQARLDVGTIRLAFVQWARELLEDDKGMAERGIDGNQLTEDARRSVDQAIEYFGSLRPDPNEANPKPFQELASYYYVISQYFRALVEPACSPSAISALQKAQRDLDEYIFAHDGQLLGIYAQDRFGLVFWELAKCEDNPEKKLEYYNKAFEWFETCIYTEDEGPDHQRVITSGYYHIAQAGLEAGRMADRNFARDALLHLERMLDQHPTAWRSDNGLRALVEWSKLECARGNANKAVEVAGDAATRAKAAGKPYLERLANRQLNEYVSGACGGTVGGLDPEVLQRVADDLFSRQQYQEAIRAYRTVINSTNPTAQDFLAYRWHAWKRMAASYGRIGDRLGEALAYEPVHDAWMRGQIPHVKGEDNDQNMLDAGKNRRRAESATKALADSTGSRVLQQRHKKMSEAFLKDYPDHPSNRVGEWNAAVAKWKLASTGKSANNSQWKKALGEARGHFQNVAKDAEHERGDAAYVYLIRCDLLEGKTDAAIAQAKKIFAYWDSPEAQKQAEEFESIRDRRKEARGAATFWLARALLDKGDTKAVLATLKEFHSEHPNLAEPYPQLGYDLLLQASLQQGDIDAADGFYRVLLEKYPKYGNLPRITSDLAGHYGAQRAVINKKLVEVTKKLNVARKGFREADREAFKLGSLLVDLNNRLRKAQQAIDWYEEDLKLGKPVNDQRVPGSTYNDALVTKEELDGKIPAEQVRQREWAQKRDTFAADRDALQVEQTALRQELYEPLVKAASYWRAWDDTLKRLDEPRDPRNVGIFGGMFYGAARLRPAALENWTAARGLFEDYLEFPQVKQKAATDAEKRDVIAKLGDVYVNIAQRQEDPAKRRALVEAAVDLMQQSLASRTADNELVVGMLSDKILVLRFRYQGRQVRFAIPRPATVKELRESVRTLGKPEGPSLPSFDNEDEMKFHERALTEFRSRIAALDDTKLEGNIVESGKSAFDPILYRDLADSSVPYRLALAWAYSETGRDEDVPKAVNLALSLVAPPLGVEEDTEEWWEARAIQLKVYLDAAERRSTGGATSTSDAKQWLERAGKVFMGIAANYPDLGEVMVPGSQKQWLDTLHRMNRLRSKEGLSKITVTVSDPSQPKEGEDRAEAPGEGEK